MSITPRLSSSRPQPDVAPEPASLVAEIRAVVAAIRRRWLWIVLSVVAALTAAVLFLMIATPRYVATAQILIDPRAKRIVEGAVVPGGYGSSAAGADTLLVDSQVELIQSHAVLKKIVEAEKLHEDAEFVVPKSGGGVRMLLRNTLGRTLFGNDRELPPQTEAVDTTVWRFADKHLRVRRLGNTYVINIAVMSRDATKAARLANALANAYINEQVRATGATTREATVALESRVADLRGRVETAENAVETFRAKAGLIGAPNLLVTEQQLQQTNDKLIAARSQTGIAKARYEQVKDLNARGGAVSLGAQSDALRSPVIANLRAALSRVERREAIVQQALRPGHPEYGSVQVEKRAVLAQIDDELNRIKANARAEFELAQSNEKALAGELKSLESQTATGNQSQVRLRELQREAQAARTIYEQFLTRAKETSEQETLGRENSRIITEATVPPYPTFPPTFLILIGALLSGLMAGAGTAWLAHVFSGQPALDTAGATRTAPARAEPTPHPTPAAPTPPTPPSPAMRPRLRKMMAPMAKPSDRRTTPGGPVQLASNNPAPPAQTGASQHVAARAIGLDTLARLPAIVAPGRRGLTMSRGNEALATASSLPTFSDHIAAVDDISAAAYPGYREAVDGLLAALLPTDGASKPTVALLVGTEPAAGTSSTALALAYRAAVTGRRTLLVDVSAADPQLSRVFAANLKQRRACVLDSEAHLAEITLHDARTGLAILPLALADLGRLAPDQQRRLSSGLRLYGRRFDLVVLDAGAAADNSTCAFLAALADKVLIVTPKSAAPSGLTRLRAMEAAQRFASRAAAPAIVETAAG